VDRLRRPLNSNVGLTAMAGMRSLAWFLGIAGLHFVLSVAGTVLALRAALDTQAGFWAAPGMATLAYVSEVLLSPLYLLRAVLPAEWRGGYAELATRNPK